MARTIKIDNALQKRFSKQEKKKKKELISYFLIVCEGEKLSQIILNPSREK